jgi:hypothetical protein
MYFSYHNKAKQLLKEGKLIGWYITNNHNNIKPALVLLFADYKHHTMPIREYRWNEYLPFLPKEKEIRNFSQK